VVSRPSGSDTTGKAINPALKGVPEQANHAALKRKLNPARATL